MKPGKRISKLIRTILLVVVLLSATALIIYAARHAWPNQAAEVQPLTVKMQPRDFDLQINANGELQAAESKAIAVPFVPVERLRIGTVVPDGRHVNQGDVLIEFDQAELDLQMLEHRSSLEM